MCKKRKSCVCLLFFFLFRAHVVSGGEACFFSSVCLWCAMELNAKKGGRDYNIIRYRFVSMSEHKYIITTLTNSIQSKTMQKRQMPFICIKQSDNFWCIRLVLCRALSLSVSRYNALLSHRSNLIHSIEYLCTVLCFFSLSRAGYNQKWMNAVLMFGSALNFVPAMKITFNWFT